LTNQFNISKSDQSFGESFHFEILIH